MANALPTGGSAGVAVMKGDGEGGPLEGQGFDLLQGVGLTGSQSIASSSCPWAGEGEGDRIVPALLSR